MLESEHSLILSHISNLNDLFAIGLSDEPIVDRYLDEDVFQPESEHRKRLILVGASHLNPSRSSLTLENGR